MVQSHYLLFNAEVTLPEPLHMQNILIHPYEAHSVYSLRDAIQPCSDEAWNYKRLNEASESAVTLFRFTAYQRKLSPKHMG